MYVSEQITIGIPLQSLPSIGKTIRCSPKLSLEHDSLRVKFKPTYLPPRYGPMLYLNLEPLVYHTNPCFVRSCKRFSHPRLLGSNHISFFKYQLFEQRARATGPFALVTQRTPSPLARVRCGFEDDFFDTQIQRGNTKKCFAGRK